MPLQRVAIVFVILRRGRNRWTLLRTHGRDVERIIEIAIRRRAVVHPRSEGVSMTWIAFVRGVAVCRREGMWGARVVNDGSWRTAAAGTAGVVPNAASDLAAGFVGDSRPAVGFAFEAVGLSARPRQQDR